MKKNVTYIPVTAIEAIVTELNIPTVTQAAFTKVMGAKGRNLYIPRGKSIGHVDFSGFTVEHLGVVDLGEKSFGNVKQMINFEGSQEVILETIKNVLEVMISLPPVEKVPKAPKAPKAEKPAKVAKAKAEPKPEPKARLPRTREERQKLRDLKLQDALEAAQLKLDEDIALNG